MGRTAQKTTQVVAIYRVGRVALSLLYHFFSQWQQSQSSDADCSVDESVQMDSQQVFEVCKIKECLHRIVGALYTTVVGA